MKSTTSRAELFDSVLLFIEKNQTDNGGFISKSFATTTNEASTNSHYTTFYPALIGSVLLPFAHLSRVKKIVDAIRAFLLAEMKADNTFSYWAKNDPNFAREPYPSDLDDTARASLFISYSETTGPENLVNFALSLIKQEKQPGGPYFTWTNHDQQGWSDIDPVVNAAVHKTLGHHGIWLESLEKYLVQCLEQNTWRSPYYANDWISLYLIYVSLSGSAQRKIKPVIDIFCNENTPQTTLEKCCKFLISSSNTEEFLESGHVGFDCNPVVIEKIENEVITYSGCESFTAALLLSIIHPTDKHEQTETIHNDSENVDSEIKDEAIKIVAHKISNLQPELRERGLMALSNLMSKPVANEILLLSMDIGLAITRSISKQAYAQLGAANFFGWMAFTLYDICYDENIISADIPLANIFIRESVQQYTTTARELETPEITITQILDIIDQAHAQEQIDTLELRKALSQRKKWLGVQTRKIAERSFGHCLGPLLIIQSIDPRPELINSYKKLFGHYLTARQMCDDLHDWPEDFQATRITSVTKSLFVISQAFSNINLFQAKKIFWKEGIELVILKAEQEISEAERIVNKLFTSHKKPALLIKSIEHLKQSIIRIKQERNIIKNMIHYFSEYGSISTIS